MQCPKCGNENPAGKKFCGDCGAALEASSTPGQSPPSSFVTAEVASSAEPTSSAEGERKTITALFADINGSTELMRDLDP